jgi:hypothetical protein
MEETFYENSKDQRETKTIGTYYMIVSEKTLVNMINQ